MRFGYFTSSLLLAKPPASKWFVAPGPRRKRSHSRPTPGRLLHLRAGATETGCVQAYWMYTSR